MVFTQSGTAAPEKAKPEQNIFKAAQFLTWDRQNKEIYIRTTIGVAGYISLQNDEPHGRCIENWYNSDHDKNNEYILGTMRRFPDYHPRGIIMAILEKQCGSFNYSS
ncbi:MAG: hypothetical protein AAFW83_08990 [Pseudomonadota bacterium]